MCLIFFICSLGLKKSGSQYVFDIPTLLYGSDSKEIYEEDIENNIFTWIDSNKEDLSDWLYSEFYANPKNLHKYIEN